MHQSGHWRAREHDAEEEQHHDRPDVDEHLDDRHELCREKDVDGGDAREDDD